MNKKILSLILIIGLISSASAGAAGDQIACGAAGSTALTTAIAAGIDKCADDGAGAATAFAAKCLAGYAFV